MQVIYANEEVPNSFFKAVFLAGPTPMSNEVQSWRPEAIDFFKEAGYDGIIFSPESRDGKWKHEYTDQVEWEEKCLHMADCILFWVPRNISTMPAFTTNTEWGVWQDSGKVVFGAPDNASKVRYQQYYANKFKVPIASSLRDTVNNAIKMIDNEAMRIGGEREVPLYIWNTSHFQQWYKNQKQAGNRLDGARVVWTFRVGPQKNFVFFWALHVNVYIANENRNKTNEVVVARPDIATIAMYRRGENLQDTDIVLIREFRSPASTVDSYVWEIPGGSSFKSVGNPKELAAAECREETGLEIDASRVKHHESRQLVSTLSAHKAHLFSVEITDDELKFLQSQKGIAHGVLEDTERTYVEVVKLGFILQDNKVDWSMLGMIMSALYNT
jgi:8-oxo-dGTP pyrophosphatase MutT (NUDIX family)